MLPCARKADLSAFGPLDESRGTVSCGNEEFLQGLKPGFCGLLMSELKLRPPKELVDGPLIKVSPSFAAASHTVDLIAFATVWMTVRVILLVPD